MSLEQEFKRLRDSHREVIKARVAKVCFSASTGRVFPKDSSAEIKKALPKIDVDHMLTIRSQEEFKTWFEQNLDAIVRVVPSSTSRGKIISEGARRWGYGAKVLNLYLRDIVLHSRYFTDDQAKQMENLLYVPLDGKVIDALEEVGVVLDFVKIKEIDTDEKFYGIQSLLGEAAAKGGVPRIWFDDHWVDT